MITLLFITLGMFISDSFADNQTMLFKMADEISSDFKDFRVLIHEFIPEPGNDHI